VRLTHNQAHPPLPPELGRRHWRGAVWQGDRPFCLDTPMCVATPAHNCVEFIGDECLLCVRDRYWAEAAKSIGEQR
jgi:hypothetical protein